LKVNHSSREKREAWYLRTPGLSKRENNVSSARNRGEQGRGKVAYANKKRGKVDLKNRSWLRRATGPACAV